MSQTIVPGSSSRDRTISDESTRPASQYWAARGSWIRARLPVVGGATSVTITGSHTTNTRASRPGSESKRSWMAEAPRAQTPHVGERSKIRRARPCSRLKVSLKAGSDRVSSRASAG